MTPRAAMGLAVLGAFATGAASVRAQVPPPDRGTPGPPRYEFAAEFRARSEARFGPGENPAREDGFALSRLRLDMTVRPADSVRIFVQAQDARIGWLDSQRSARPFQNAVDLRQGYVAVGREDGPATFYAGRRELKLLDERLLGGRNWSNTSPVWDGAMLALRRGRDSIRLFGATQVDLRDGLDVPSRTRFVYGALGTIESWLDGQRIEPFVFSTRRPASVTSRFGGLLRTAGARVSGRFGEAWDYQVILAAQGGGLPESPQRAWAGVWALGRTFESLSWQPRLAVEWSQASGDSDPSDGRNGTFDTLFPSPHRIHGEQDVTGFRNLRTFKAGVDLRPLESVRLDFDFLDFRLATLRDGLYAASSRLRIAAPTGGAASASIGSELDFVIRYAPRPGVELRLGVSRFFAGDFVTRYLPAGGSQTFLTTALLVRL